MRDCAFPAYAFRVRTPEMKHCLLDSSFIIDLLNEIAGGKAGAAINWLARNGSAALWISPVTLAEVLEGADDPDAVKDYLRRYSWQGIHRVHADLVAKLSGALRVAWGKMMPGRPRLRSRWVRL